VPAETLSVALSGIESAQRRVQVASQNIANLNTKDFHPIRAQQSSVASGGSVLETERSPEPEPVSVAGEYVGMDLAAVQAKASARVVATDLDLLGSLLDLHA